MPLVLAPIGQEVRIVKIVADEKTKKHLANLGLLVDATVTVLSSAGGARCAASRKGGSRWIKTSRRISMSHKF